MDNRILVDFKNLHNLKGYAAKYLTTHALEDTEFSFTIDSNLTTDDIKYISYSLDNGETWVTTQNINGQQVVITTPVVAAGNDVLWKGRGVCVGKMQSTSSSTTYYCIFSSTGNYEVSGNYTSLMFDEYFVYATKLPETETIGIACSFKNSTTLISAENLILPEYTISYGCYRQMFYGCTGLTTAPELPATTLADDCYMYMFYSCSSLTTAPELPATILADYCYSYMFYGCSSLTTAPELPVVTLTRGCYSSMFRGCTSLTSAPSLSATALTYNCYSSMFNGCTGLIEAPELPATTLESGCYQSMFQSCTGLITAPELPATTLAVSCYNSMFYGCTSLTTAPKLPVITLAQSCYNSMFRGCTSLTTAPELPATILTDYCYQNMFYGCTSLTTAPELPATVLGSFCYYEMFSGCTSLTTIPSILPALRLKQSCYRGMFYGCNKITTAPELPATVLINYCYYQMFYKCSNLNYIKALFTTTPSNTYTQAWVSGVASNGTFVKNSEATWTTTGTNAVPSNWTITTEDVQIDLSQCFVVESLENCTVTATFSTNGTIQYSIDNGNTWITHNISSSTASRTLNISINQNNKIYWINSTVNGKITASGRYKLAGQLQAFSTNTTCESLFKNDINLVSAKNLILPIISVSRGFYECFSGCINLIDAPEVPLITYDRLFRNMFYGCTSLQYPPSILYGGNNPLYNGCYENMFNSCTSLLKIPSVINSTLTISGNSCNHMFNGCESLISASTLIIQFDDSTTSYDMFADCTSLKTPPQLPTTKLISNCYKGFFKDCTSLETAPELPATELVDGCYDEMFAGCTNLSYIKADFLTEPSSTYTNNWVSDVSINGTFVKNSNATWNEFGTNAIPATWDVIPTKYTNYFTTEAIDDCVFSLTLNSALSTDSFTAISYSIDDGETWITTNNIDNQEVIVTTSTIVSGNKVLWKGVGKSLQDSYFSSTGNYNISGNINTLLTATVLPMAAFRSLFKNSINLLSAENLILSTKLSNRCYQSMFQGCTLLTTAPKLPATTLAYNCYNSMFYGCTALTTAPELPATTLAQNCYQSMFLGCTSLTTAPELPAITLANYCYTEMFYGCSNLNYINAAFTTTPSSNYTNNWVYGVASTGTFIKNELATWNVNSTYGVPIGWQITKLYPYFVTEAIDNCIFQFTINAEITKNMLESISYSVDNGETWVTTNNISGQIVNVVTPTITSGNIVLWKGIGNTFAISIYYTRFSSSGRYNIKGCIKSLLTNISEYAYYNLFSNSTNLISAQYLLLSTTLANYCYQSMFYGCSGLTIAPELPATTLANYCYRYMFQGCTSLSMAPELPATTLANYCYCQMFYGCKSLTTAPELPATTLANNCYADMFNGCTSLTTTPKLPATTLANSCYYYMFYGCTGLTTVPELPATTLVNDCYRCMFYGCTKLNYIKAAFTTTPGSAYTNSWVYNVASYGTFVKNSEATWDVRGTNGVPTNWTIQTYIIPDISDYFALEAIDDCVFTLTINQQVTTTDLQTVNYSIDNGETWIATNNIDNQKIIITTPTIASGNKVYWKCDGYRMSSGDASTVYSGSCYPTYFSSTGKYKVSGQLELLLNDNTHNSTRYKYGGLFQNSDNLISANELIFPDTIFGTADYMSMFQNCTSLIELPILPQTTVSNFHYYYMFSGCTSLTTAPELPATTLANYCYQNMFYGCTSLTTAPQLPATTLTTNCYQNMFYGCTSLTTAPELPATTLANYCYSGMFKGCTSLTTAPQLPATTLTNYCYSGMFNGCTSLTTAPQLPATTLANYCYYLMFSNCITLTNIPKKLPATTLTQQCYRYMFQNCKSLTTAPELPATTLVSNCYSEMFYGCTNLSYINAAFTTTPGSSYTNNWVYGVAQQGTFCKNISATWNVSGINGIPQGWTVDVSWPSSYNYFATQSLANNTQFIFTIPQNRDTNDITYVEYSTDNGNTWVRTNNVNNQQIIIRTPNISSGNKVLWRANAKSMQQVNITASQRYNVEGKLDSLICLNQIMPTSCFYCLFRFSSTLVSAENLILLNNTNWGCYVSMFQDCTALTTAPELPATVLSDYCYNNMFSSCTALTAAPELPAITLQNGCYDSMFYGCTGLTTAPELPATTLVSNCYNKMFYRCSNLNYINAAFTTTPDSNYTYNWVYGVASTGTFIKSKNASWDVTGPNGVPQGWTVPSYESLMTIWIDDFPGYLQMKYAVNDPEGSGANEYIYSGNTITYNNKTCYIWNQNSDNGCPNMILTSTADLQTLQNQALDTAGFYAHFTALEAFMDDEETEYAGNDTKLNTDDTRLVSVYEEGNELHLWLDDFHYLEVYTYDDFINNPEQCGSNRYDYFGNTMEIDGDEYYVWEAYDSDGSPAKVLTTTADINTLNTQSIKTSGEYTNFDAFFAALFEDDEIRYDIDSEWGKAIQLIKIINNGPKEPIMGMWIDDFPADNPNIIADYGSIEGAIDNAIEDPAGHGSNLYIYYGDTFEYDGNTYYIWYHDNYDDDFQFTALTTSIDLGELQNQSVGFTGNYNVQFTLLYAFGNIENDGNVYIQEENDYDQVLLTVFEY